MKKVFLLAVMMIGFIAVMNAQTVFVENFSYPAGSLLTANGWTAHSGTGTNPQTVVSPGLTYAGYPASGIGGAVYLNSTGEDVSKRINPTDSIVSGAVYAAMMVKVDTGKTGEYFFHLGPATMGTTFRLRVFAKLAANGKIAFGVSKSSISATVLATYTDSIYNTGTTYLIVAKYQFVAGTTGDDLVSLWVNPAISGVEPPPQITQTDVTSGSDAISIGTVAIRQGTATGGPVMTLDGIRIAQSWGGVLPVELTAFSALVNGRDVQLTWSTASEINNKEFVVERKIADAWETLGRVSGNGTTTQRNSYSFIDNEVPALKAVYRLRQVDFDGSITYSNSIEVEIGVSQQFELLQNYPNPFNPSTVISYRLPESGFVSLKIYDQMGSEVATLVNQLQDTGTHTAVFNAAGFGSGVYYYELHAGSSSTMKKALLMK